MDKNTKRKKAEKAKAEEEALNRILCWVAGGAVLEFLLLLLNRYWSHYTVAQIDLRVALGTAVRILAVAALVCAAGAGYWWNSARKSRGSARVPGVLCLFMAGVSVSCFAAWIVSGTGLQLMSFVVPAVVILALIYYLYQREFFLIACQSALTFLGIWLCGKGLSSSYRAVCYAYAAGAGFLLLLLAFLCRRVQNNRGEAEPAGRSWRLLPKDTNPVLLYAGAVIALGTIIVAATGISSAALYAVAVTWLLVMAVYYTVKLM